MAAHVTGMCSDDVAEFLTQVDVITGCASKKIRELVQPLIQVGTAIPLFGLTPKGKELLIERAKDIESPLMINTMALPVLPEEKQPKPLIN